MEEEKRIAWNEGMRKVRFRDLGDVHVDSFFVLEDLLEKVL